MAPQDVFLCCLGPDFFGQQRRQTTNTPTIGEIIRSGNGPSDDEIERARERIRLNRISHEREEAVGRSGPVPRERMVYGGPSGDLSLENHRPSRRPLRHVSVVQEEKLMTKEELDSKFIVGDDEDDDVDDDDGIDDEVSRKLKAIDSKVIAKVSEELKANLYVKGHPLNPFTPEEEAAEAVEKAKKARYSSFWAKNPDPKYLVSSIKVAGPAINSTGQDSNQIRRKSTPVVENKAKGPEDAKSDYYYRHASPPRERSQTAEFFDADANLMDRARSLKAEAKAKKATHENMGGDSEDSKTTQPTETPLTTDASDSTIPDDFGPFGEVVTEQTSEEWTVITLEQASKEKLDSKFITNESDWSVIALEDNANDTSNRPPSGANTHPKPLTKRAKPLSKFLNNHEGHSSREDTAHPLKHEAKTAELRSRFVEDFEDAPMPTTDSELVKGERMAAAAWVAGRMKESNSVQNLSREEETPETKHAVKSAELRSRFPRYFAGEKPTEVTDSKIKMEQPTGTLKRGRRTLQDELAGLEFDEEYDEIA